jgi:hypothetical protein
MMRAFVCFSGRRPELSRLIRTESSTGGEPFEDLFAKWFAGPMSFLQRELTAAAEDGTIRSIDARFAYFALIGAGTQAFAEPETARRAFGLDVRDKRTIDQYADFVVDLVLRGLLTSGASTSAPQRPAARKGRSSRRRA